MNLFLECKPDEVLAMTLGVARKNIIHSDDKGGVCRRLCKSHRMKGMIDQDTMSPQPIYLKELSETNSEYGIIKLEDRSRLHTVAVICPKLEDWFLEVCKRHKMDVKQYGLPKISSRLHEEINFKLGNFQRALQQLLQDGNLAVLHLQSVLLVE